MKFFTNITTAKTIDLDYIADRAILFLSGLSLLVFVLFAWTIAEASKVNAQSSTINEQSCGGKNLIAHYAANDPTKLKMIKAEAEKIINGKSIFWEIEKKGVPTSYLLGTMHMADERIAKLEGTRLEAFNKTNLLIVENTDALDPKKAQAAMAKLQHLTMLKDETLNDLLDADTLKLLKPVIAARGIPFAVAIKLRPWLVATTISIPSCELAAKKTGKPVLDALLGQKARETNKQIIGLETVEEQLSAIANMPREFHVTALKETLHIGNEIKDVLETMKQLYISGNMAMVQPLMKAVSSKPASLEGKKRFEEQLIVNRNKIMAQRSAEHLAKGNVFLAVGALHLLDETGLVKLIRDMGYTVSAVK